MSKLVGASFIVIGTGGIALALLKDTKYDPLVKLGITKPKITSKIQQDFRCEVLFLKIATNFFAKFEIQRQINAINSNEGFQGIKILSPEEKSRVAELQAQKDKVEKIYLDSLAEYNSTICGQELDAMDCINNSGKCIKKSQFTSDCLNNANNYFTQYNFWLKVESDLKELSDADFRKKYVVSTLRKDAKSWHKTELAIKLKEIAELKKAYESCDIANVDCVTLKENIATLTDQYNRYKADPDSNRLSSPVRAEMLSSKEKLDFLQQLFNKTDCSSQQLVRTGVNYKDVRDCIEQDEVIKSLIDDIAYRKVRRIKSSTNASDIILQRLQDRLLTEQNDFITKGCKGRLESDKLKSNAITITDLASQQEKNVLKKNITEQYVYIGIGALVLLTGFYIVLKK